MKKSSTNFLGTLINTIERWANIVGTWLIMVLMVIVCADVIHRGLLGSSIIGAIELSVMLMVGITALTLAFTQHENGHVRMELVIGKLEGRTRQWVEIFAITMCLAFSILIFIMTVKLAIDSVAVMEIIEGISGLPLWPWKILIPVGFLLLIIRLTIQLVQHIKLLFSIKKV